MATLTPVDRVEIQVLMDNVTDSLSTVPAFAETEFSYLHRHGLTELAGEAICAACHGFACLVTVYRGTTAHTLLFDAGSDGAIFARNCDRLGVDLGAVEGVILSHGHWDHAGGLLAALDLIRERRKAETDCYVHPGMFVARANKLHGQMFPLKQVPSPDELRAHGARPIESAEPLIFGDGMFLVSGEIPRVTPFERGLSTHYRRSDDGSDWVPDPMIVDERSLMVHVAGKGIVIFTACSHAGIVNVLSCARERVPNEPIYAIIGGLHLVGANEPLIPQTVEAMQAFEPQIVAPAHCTGWRAVNALVAAFGEPTVSPSAVGKRFVL